MAYLPSRCVPRGARCVPSNAGAARRTSCVAGTLGRSEVDPSGSPAIEEIEAGAHSDGGAGHHDADGWLVGSRKLHDHPRVQDEQRRRREPAGSKAHGHDAESSTDYGQEQVFDETAPRRVGDHG
ncbi:hypothetical protein GCM10009846_28450 [Agrococcus versicolor]|uniref:Uncharacterized protein n=1 Tax=Agrococcus versicolor TaxID=501482 RepID=A0ABP5MPE2_9MICO